MKKFRVDCPQIYEKSVEHYSDHYKYGIYYLSNKHFKSTYRITKPGIYILKEDIIFDPDIKYLPNETQYTLGFFAAITCETSHVTIDLNGHEIKQSKYQSIFQTFFSTVELNKSPFLKGQGPFDFGDNNYNNDIIICNGIFGLSSHHCIHGNGCEGVGLYDLVFKDFEVAAFQLNGCNNVNVNRFKILRSRQDKPFNANFSVLVHIRHFVSRELRKEIQKKIESLMREYREFGTTFDSLFKNDHRTTGGNVYGFLVGPIGVATGGLAEKFPVNPVRNVKIMNGQIQHLKCKVEEVIGLCDKDGKGVMTGPVGATFRFHEWCYPDGTYKENILSKAMLSTLGKGKNTISQNIIDWCQGKISKKELLERTTPKGNGDIMFHVNKGVNVMRFDSIQNLVLKNIIVKSITNIGNMGEKEICGNYHRSHDLQHRDGYLGADVNVLIVSSCKECKFENLYFKNINSYNGRVVGVSILYDCSNISIDNIKQSYYNAGRTSKGRWMGINYYDEKEDYSSSLPNRIPCCVGFDFDIIINLNHSSFAYSTMSCAKSAREFN